ncbi:restriction endonuclease subunit S [Pseudoalteromonas sp. S1688]|uniref:restriction endonuclease subunit S n=1 Tax=Pseudoalteromonas sp. S1688 TaxID=579511 RepID=UPI0014872159|nr:restriction endonuclease subunit S [Pseudoalteromonas sp. S1688]
MDANLLSLPKHWAIKTLVELTVQKNISYGIVQPGKHENDGIPIIRVNNFNSSGLDVSNVMKVAPKIANKSLKTSLKKNDLLLTLVGSTGLTYIVPKKYEGWNVARAVAVIRTDDTVSADWIKICLDSTFTKYFLDSRANTTVQKTLNLSDVKQVPIPIPLAHERAFIEKNIGNLNKKIELNQKTNQTLEKMAQALFKSWFVDFDPVFDNLLASVDFNLDNLEGSLPNELKQKAQRRLVALNSLENVAQCKASLSALAHELQAQLPTKEATQAAVQILGKTAETPVKANLNANPNILAQHANTHAHFPNEFEHNEQLGWIPKGWENGTFKDIADGLSGYAFKGKDFSETGFAVLKIKNITTDRSVVINDVNRVSPEVIDKLQRFLLNDGDIIMAMTGATVGKFGVLVSEDNEAYYLNQRVCKLTPKMEKGNPFLFSALNQPGVEEGILSAAQGSAQPNISANGILATKLLVPSKKTIEIFNRLLEDIYERKITLRKECYKLTKLRDTLLPKLISGELQIPDVATDEEVVD